MKEITGEEAMRASNIMKFYCEQHTPSCDYCVFYDTFHNCCTRGDFGEIPEEWDECDLNGEEPNIPEHPESPTVAEEHLMDLKYQKEKNQLTVGDLVKVTKPNDSFTGLLGSIFYILDSDADRVVVDFGKGHGMATYDTKDLHLVDMSNPAEFPTPPKDNTPNYYNGTVDPLDLMRAQFSEEAYEGFIRGNIIKYASRYGKKDNKLSEAKKIFEYAKFLYCFAKAQAGGTQNEKENNEA